MIIHYQGNKSTKVLGTQTDKKGNQYVLIDAFEYIEMLEAEIIAEVIE